MELNNFIFVLLFIFFSYFFNKYLIFICKKKKFNFLVDDQFKKPQAFHRHPTLRLGGVALFFLFLIFSLYVFLSKNIFVTEYLSFCILFFLLGLMDDLKINIKPKFRLLSMILCLIILVISNQFYIVKTGLDFLNHLLEIDIFSLFFICLCFLFIINGSNLIDGFNGLLSIHSLIILLILFFIALNPSTYIISNNLITENKQLIYILFYSILTILIFLIFNFPKAQMFLGDSGAYFLGAFISVSTIKMSILNYPISPFFFCILLFYLFFEVFFSFFRKLFIAGQSPLLPDSKHLHMFVYKLLLKKNKDKLKSNYQTSIIINLFYLLLISPAVIFMNDGVFCRTYFFFLIIVYLYFYKMLYNKLR